jgi:hypothetical protein
MMIVDDQIDICIVLQVTWLCSVFTTWLCSVFIQNENDEWKNERTIRNVSMLKVEI